MVILEENFKWHLEAFAPELFIYLWVGAPPNGCLLNSVQKRFSVKIA